ncbi:DUF5309 family protein [candidate division WWE3 bacterium]|jgi:hypothetical protein|nr:DUF5309 family protein [candidate division WWE3 bacterium]
MAITQGTKKSYDITAAVGTASGIGQDADVRQLYSWGDEVASLNPEESPFFVYLSNVAKIPVDSSVFRFTEDRTKTEFASRTFQINGAIGTVVANSTYSFTVDANSASVDWLIKGQVFNVTTVYGTGGYAQVPVRIEDTPIDQGTTTSFTGKIIDLSNANVSGYNSIADDDFCQVVGTSFIEGSGAPDVWSNEISEDFGYTQIFKTAAELTNTAIATKYRGYADEWDRIWNLKLREHKVDIERAMLFGQRALRGNIRYTEGVIGHILKNANPSTSDAALSYTSGVPYYRSVAAAEMIFDRLLGDFEVLYDPARGGSGDRLVLCSLPVITMFNKLADGNFLYESLQASTTHTPLGMNFDIKDGNFGHKLHTIDTIHGTAHLVKEPLFRGPSMSLMAFIDMSMVKYRPLVGNGLNRDTFIKTNVQAADEDLRKDLITTEAGLELALPESHMLYNIEGFTQTL